MSIETPEAPKPSIEALHAMLPTFIASASIRQTAPHFAASLLASPQSLASPGLSYPVYALGLADVASGAGVRRAKLSAWRHEFAAEGEVVSAEVSAGRRPQFAGLNVNSRFRSVLQERRPPKPKIRPMLWRRLCAGAESSSMHHLGTWQPLHRVPSK